MDFRNGKNVVEDTNTNDSDTENQQNLNSNVEDNLSNLDITLNERECDKQLQSQANDLDLIPERLIPEMEDLHISTTKPPDTNKQTESNNTLTVLPQRNSLESDTSRPLHVPFATVRLTQICELTIPELPTLRGILSTITTISSSSASSLSLVMSSHSDQSSTVSLPIMTTALSETFLSLFPDLPHSSLLIPRFLPYQLMNTQSLTSICSRIIYTTAPSTGGSTVSSAGSSSSVPDHRPMLRPRRRLTPNDNTRDIVRLKPTMSRRYRGRESSRLTSLRQSLSVDNISTFQAQERRVRELAASLTGPPVTRAMKRSTVSVSVPAIKITKVLNRRKKIIKGIKRKQSRPADKSSSSKTESDNDHNIKKISRTMKIRDNTYRRLRPRRTKPVFSESHDNTRRWKDISSESSDDISQSISSSDEE